MTGGRPTGQRTPRMLDRYAYVLHNPLRSVDPSGQRTYFIGGIGGAQDIRSYEDFVIMLENAGLRDVALPFTPYSGQSKVVNSGRLRRGIASAAGTSTHRRWRGRC